MMIARRRLLAGLTLSVAMTALGGGCRQGPATPAATSRTSPLSASDSPPGVAAPRVDPSTQSPTTPASAANTTAPPIVVRPFEGVAAFISKERPAESRVEVQAWTCLEEGWLEQVACIPGTREHEALLVVQAKPSQIHAALLMAGFQPGSPGRWTYEDDSFGAIDPTGDAIDVSVEYEDPARPGERISHPIARWIRGPQGEPFGSEPWVFGGSVVAPNPAGMEPEGGGEHYVADYSGSVVGLVTFGDEVVGFSRVLSDQDAVQEPLWEANPETLPPAGTPVTLIFTRHIAAVPR